MGEWERESLAHLTTGRPICYGVLKPGDRQREGVPLVRVTDIRLNYLNESGLYLITPELSAEFKRSELRGGEVLLSIQGTVGRVAICPDHLRGANVSRTIAVIAPDSRIDRSFLRYWLLSQEGRFPISGSTRASFNIGDIRKLQVPLPPMSEQEQIVAILDESFTGLATATANAEKNLANARELFQSVVDHRIADSADGWRTQELQQDVRFIDYRGRTPRKTEEGMRLITAKNVKMGVVQQEPREYVDPGIYDGWMTRGIPMKGDVLFTTEAPLGNVAQLHTSERVVFAQRVITLQPNRDVIDPTMLHYVLRSSIVQRRIQANATGATATGIKASLLKKITIPLPKGIDMQARLASELTEVEEECKRLAVHREHKLTLLAELKQSILHKAFTGELTADFNAADATLSKGEV